MVTFAGAGQEKQENILGELEDLLGPFEQQKIIVNDRLVKQNTLIALGRSVSQN